MRTELEHSDQNPASEVARFRKEYLQVRLDAFGEVVGSTNGAEAVSI
jgi:hypothetical protein